ncbi:MULTISPECIES: hypothetical protein [Calothrix]|uniref:Inactive STAND domain-containing protein n=2 Tax=Calothrix TaxID=1186 RepID=A0ABR8AHL9_9CYAN|nr:MULTISPECIES: hypothetical protein [Calothrix]MBD2199426.1 hypothetical protein [Calothrix parietina FACHB-288]MBD2228227.1 hypothetical protein [Calothrix anomala FACHB-343]
MQGLPSELNKLCFDVFLECEEYFDDYRKLRELCKSLTEVYGLHYQIQTGSSIHEVVENNLSVIIKFSHPKHGWALIIIVRVLQERYKSLKNPLSVKLDDLHNKLQEYETKQSHSYTQNENNIFVLESKLFKLISQIDFNKQEEAFHEAITVQAPKDKDRAAAFLIHGPEKHGQKVLFERLVKLLFKLVNYREYREIPLGGISSTFDVWSTVARYLVDSQQLDDLSRQDIMNKVLECLQTKHIIFRVDDVHSTNPKFLNDLIDNFWTPIINHRRNIINGKTNQKYSYKEPCFLVMFWIDNNTQVCNWEIPKIDNHEDSKYPQHPLILAEASPFLDQDLNKWLRIADDEIISNYNISVDTLKTFLASSQSGVPELVYKTIYEHCGHFWEGR